jgi:arsenate reductase-like glutaredoxin family protein
MAIQIFGTAKNFDVKKAERWFSERRISFQSIDLGEKGISAGELDSVLSCLEKSTGSRKAALEQIIDKKNKKYADIAWIADEDREQKLLENPLLIKQPVVRNGRTAATAGWCPDVWSTWTD